jgi:hypothetical protein
MIRRFRNAGFALGLVLGLTGCSGNSTNCSSNPTGPGCAPPPTTLPPCTQTVIDQSGATGLGSFQVAYRPFTTTSTGRLDVTVDWTFPASPIAVYLVRGDCSIAALNQRTCDFVLRSEATTTPKPRKLSAGGVAAGSYQLLVGNAGSQNEATSAQVVQSSATCPPFSIGRASVLRESMIQGAWSLSGSAR